MASLFAALLPELSQATERLCVYAVSEEEPPLASYDLPEGGDFALSFIHSVSMTPVRDIYRIKRGTIVQTAEVFITHGAGLPSFTDELDATGWRHENGKFILDMDRRIGSMLIRVQPEYDNVLHIGTNDIRLVDLGRKVLRLAACVKKDEE